MFQLAVSAAVTAAMTILNPNKSIGPGYNPYPQNHENFQEHENEVDESNKVIWKKRKGQSSQGPSKKLKNVAVQVATNPAAVPIVQATTTPVISSKAQAPVTGYAGNLPWCSRCSYHHYIPGPCRKMICKRCGKKGHLARSCRTLVQHLEQTFESSVEQVYYSCREIGHFKRNCPKATTPNNVNNAEMVLALKQEEAAANPTNIVGRFLF